MSDEHDNQPSIRDLGVDLNSVEAPVPLPATTYPAIIKDAKIKPTKANDGSEYISLTLYVSPDDYPHDYVDGNPDGELLTYNRLSFSTQNKRALYKLKKFLEMLGIPLSNKFDPGELVGHNVNIKVKHGSWEGETRAEIDAISEA